MNLEPTILVVSARDPDERVMAELERHGLFVERSRLDAFADTFPLVAPDLVVCLGGDVAPAALSAMLQCDLTSPAPLAVICRRGQEDGIRALHSKLLDLVLPADLPLMTMGSQLASAARRIHGRALTAIRSRGGQAPSVEPLSVGGGSSDALPHRRPAGGRLTALLDQQPSRLAQSARRAPEPAVAVPTGIFRFRQRSPDRSQWLRGGKARRAVVGDVNPRRAEAIALALSERGLDVLVVPLDPYRTEWALLQAHEPEVVLVDQPSVEGPAQVWLQLFQADRQLGKVRVVKMNLERVYDEVDEQVSLAALEPHIEELSSYRSEMPTIVAEEDFPAFDAEEEERPTLIRDESALGGALDSLGIRQEDPTALRVDLSELNSPPGARSFSARSSIPPPTQGPGTSPFPHTLGATRPRMEDAPRVQLAEAVAHESRPTAPATSPQSPFPSAVAGGGPGGAPAPPVAVAFPPLDRPGLRTPVPHPGAAQPPVQSPFPPAAPVPFLGPTGPRSATVAVGGREEASGRPPVASNIPSSAPPQSVPTSPLWSTSPSPARSTAPPPAQPRDPPGQAALPNGLAVDVPEGAQPAVELRARRRPAPTTSSRTTASSARGFSSNPPPELESRTALPGVAKVLLALVPAVAVAVFGVVRWAPGWLPTSLLERFPTAESATVPPTPRSAAESSASAGAEPPPSAAPSEPELNPWVVPPAKVSTCAQVAEPPAVVTGATIERGSMAFDRARRLLVLGDMEAAHRHMCESVLNNPQSLALEGLSEYYLLKHAPEEAVRWAERALASREDSRKAGELLGDAKSQLGHLAEARDAWVAALQIDPADGKTASLVAASYVQEAESSLGSRDLRRAESMARRAAGLDPDSSAASAVLGSALLAQGFVEHAKLWAKRCREQDEGDPYCLVLRGQLLEDAGKPAEAEALYVRVTETNPNSKRAWQALGRLRSR